jgi:hypothetical protein
MNLTKEKLDLIRKDIEELFATYNEKSDIELKTGSIVYGDNNFTMKITGTVKGSTPIIATDYEQRKKSLNLPDLNTTVTIRNENFVIKGWKRSMRKYPIILERISDKAIYKVDVATIIKSKSTII